MYDQISRVELNELASTRGGHRVSIYMPTVTAGPETRQNPIRWKNLLRQAQSDLKGLVSRPEDAKRMLSPGWDLEDDFDFWQNQGEGLGAYFDGDSMHIYRLPVPVEEIAVVSDEFHVKPLLPLFYENGPFCLLALSQGEVRLFSGHRFSLTEVKVPDMPKSMEDALWADQHDDQLQSHSVNTGIGGRGDAVFHSSGDEAQARHKVDIKRYFDIVDHAVRAYLHDQRAPLVVASVEYLQPIYREANSYGNLLDEGLTGSPENLTMEQLGQEAWRIVEKYYRADEERAAERFGNQTGTGLAETDLKLILPAAAQGRVDTLWLSTNEELWGVVADDGSVDVVHGEKAAGDKDLMDVAASRTVANGGRIFAVEQREIPGGGVMAALLRY
jgi:hypothetical protein